MTILQEIEDYIRNAGDVLKALPKEKLTRLIEMIEEAYKQSKKIITMGNGGHGATASHYVNDLSKHLVVTDDKKKIVTEKRLRALCLNDNVSTLTGWGNDMGYENCFSEPLKNWVEKGDLVIGISGSGNSENILNAFQIAKKKGAHTVCLSGRNGGKAKHVTELSIIVPCQEMLYIEDLHMLICHLTIFIVRKRIQKGKR